MPTDPELTSDQVDALERLAQQAIKTNAVVEALPKLTSNDWFTATQWAQNDRYQERVDAFRALEQAVTPETLLALIAGWRRGLAQAQATKEQP